MRKLVTAITIFCGFLFASLPSWAEIYELTVIGEYIMGDNDTKIEARRMALEHAKRIAAEKAGAYLESTTIVKDNMLTTDEIRSYSSAILQTSILSENLSILQNKTTLFELSVKATVDTSALDHKVRELNADNQRKEQLLKLQAENQELLTRLEKLSHQLDSSSSKELKMLRDQRDELFTKIDKNNNAIHITFAKGTLADLAIKNQNSLAENMAKIDRIMKVIQDSIEVKVGPPDVRHGGATSDIIVPISWTAKESVLAENSELFESVCHFNESSKSSINYLKSRIFSSGCDFLDTLNKEKLNKYWNQYEIIISVSAGSNIGYFEVKRSRSTHFSLNGRGNYERSIDTSELGNISNIDAKVEVIDPDTVEKNGKRVRKVRKKGGR